MSVISNICKNLNLLALVYCTFMCSMSDPRYQNMVRFENFRRRHKVARCVPVACRVCDRVFFDNYSLVIHFDEAHNTDTNLATVQDLRDGASHEGFQTIYDYSRPFFFPFRLDKSPNVLVRNGGQIPRLMNSMPPLGAPNYPLGLNMVLPLPLSGANNEKPLINQLEKRLRETIDISDDEDEELDLTLKL